MKSKEDEEDKEVCKEKEEEEEEECWYSVINEVKRPRIVWRSLK
jgi:hypothetical protein